MLTPSSDGPLGALHARLTENVFSGEGIADTDVRLPLNLIQRLQYLILGHDERLNHI